jgi:two-component system chemotaxis response regulator CheV
MILEAIHEAGYSNVTTFSNGQECWDKLDAIRRDISENGGDVANQVSCIITDIEMPKMDGHRLTKLIKDDHTLRKLPVIIFSSLIDEAMRVKGDELGANAQLSKPEIGNLVGTIDELILK